MNTQALAPQTCVVRDTASHKGRTRSVDPRTAPTRYLHYGRIILDADSSPLQFATDDMETGLICLRGSATVYVDTATHAVARYDAIYAPRDATIDVVPGPDGCDFAEI